MGATVPFADISFGDLLLLVAEFFLLVIWIWILFTIITDLFRDHELSGWWKAVWILFLVFIPFLAALVYLVARGNGMRDRTIKAQAEAKKHFDEYVQTQAGPRPPTNSTSSTTCAKRAPSPTPSSRARRRSCCEGQAEHRPHRHRPGAPADALAGGLAEERMPSRARLLGTG